MALGHRAEATVLMRSLREVAIGLHATLFYLHAALDFDNPRTRANLAFTSSATS